MGVRVNGRTWSEGDHPRAPDGEFIHLGGGRHGEHRRADVQVQASGGGGGPAPTERIRSRQLDRLSEAELRTLAEQHRPGIVADFDGEPSRRQLTSAILHGERRAGLIRSDTPTPVTQRGGEVQVIDARQASAAETTLTDMYRTETRRFLDIVDMPRADVIALHRQYRPDYTIYSNMSKPWLAGNIVHAERANGSLPDPAAVAALVPERRRHSLRRQVETEERALRRARRAP